MNFIRDSYTFSLYKPINLINHSLHLQIPNLFRFSPDKPEGAGQDGKKQCFIGMLPKILEVFGVDEDNEEGDAEFACNVVLVF
jgi:hypothetical protein